MDDVIELLAMAAKKDEYGVDRKEYTAREVFCKVRSISRAEFFDGGRNGLNPEYEFAIFAEDYRGETVIRYKGKTYAVYRTYLPENEDYIELYVERKGGTNGKNGAA